MIVTGVLYKYIYAGFMSIATLNAVYMWCQVYVTIYKMVVHVFGSHITSWYRDRKFKFLISFRMIMACALQI
jgi:hypothetical protein